MDFGYSSLKNAEMEGIRLGRWKDKPVFAASRTNLPHKGTGAFYIVYDDENLLVEKVYNNGTWYACGTVSKVGNVSEFENRHIYHGVEKKATAAPTVEKKKRAEEKCEPTAEVMGDVKLGLDVEATLRTAREMTVESLLEGFNYGLD